jgi:hypothetical protein
LSEESNPTQSITIELLQYFGQVIYLTTISFGVDGSGDTLSAIENLIELNTTIGTNDSDYQQRVNEAFDYYLQGVADPINEAISGCFWLFPLAVRDPYNTHHRG